MVSSVQNSSDRSRSYSKNNTLLTVVKNGEVRYIILGFAVVSILLVNDCNLTIYNSIYIISCNYI